MSEVKFTPAPWAAINENNCSGWKVVKQRVRDKNLEWEVSQYDASVVMAIGDHTDPETTENERANAHLIAAAPEMYKVLIELRGFIPDTGMIDYINSLLAKARGE